MPDYAPDPSYAAGADQSAGPAGYPAPDLPGPPGPPRTGHASGPGGAPGGGRSRRNLVLGGVAAVVVAALIGGGVWFLTDDDKDDSTGQVAATASAENTSKPSPTPTAAAPGAPSAAASPKQSPTTTRKLATTPATGAPAPGGAAPGAKKCEPAPGAPKKSTYPSAPPMTIDASAAYTMTLVTSCGTVTVNLNAAKAPTTVNSFAFLAGQDYFDHTPCHRLTTQGLFVLQCGDPTGTGSGGPGYQFADENLAGATYPAGTVAMANAGPGTNGSQFFLVYKDTQLPADYTPFGTVTGGMDVLRQVAAEGVWDGSGDGMPKALITLDDVTVAKK